MRKIPKGIISNLTTPHCYQDHLQQKLNQSAAHALYLIIDDKKRRKIPKDINILPHSMFESIDKCNFYMILITNLLLKFLFLLYFSWFYFILI